MTLLRIQDAADLCAVSRKTIERAIAAGELATIRMGENRGAVRIRRADLDAYIESRRVVQPAASPGSVYAPARLVRRRSSGSSFRDQLRAAS